jgi:CYTH domain-containing protein/predicted ATPase
MKNVPTIVITGGPCAGKSTSMSHMCEWLLGLGYIPLVLEEVPTRLMRAGFRPTLSGLTEALFQTQLMKEQVAQEARLYEMARVLQDLGHKPLILLDRGYVDTRAYMSESDHVAVATACGLDPHLRGADRYDAVIHLRTAALGAVEFYTIENNDTRRESVGEAVDADERTLAAWIGHPHLRVVENILGGNLHKKIQLCKEYVGQVLGIPAPLEYERRFLLQTVPTFPLSVVTHDTLITQLYTGLNTRVRARTISGSVLYTKTRKVRHELFGHHEYEERIDGREYHQLALTHIVGTRPIRKKRTCFVWSGNYFELDSFEHDSDLFILEVELLSPETPYELPPFVSVIKEITDDRSYSNFALAQL